MLNRHSSRLREKTHRPRAWLWRSGLGMGCSSSRGAYAWPAWLVALLVAPETGALWWWPGLEHTCHGKQSWAVPSVQHLVV